MFIEALTGIRMDLGSKWCKYWQDSFILPGSGDVTSTNFLCEKSLLFLRFRMINAARAMIPTTIPTARTIAHACPFLFSVASVISAEDKPVKTYYMFIVTKTLTSSSKAALIKDQIIDQIREQTGLPLIWSSLYKHVNGINTEGLKWLLSKS